MKRFVVSALAAVAVSAATTLFPGRAAAPAKVVMVDVVSVGMVVE